MQTFRSALPPSGRLAGLKACTTKRVPPNIVRGKLISVLRDHLAMFQANLALGQFANLPVVGDDHQGSARGV